MQWVVTSNVEREVWRRLFEFANEEIAIKAITVRHGAASDQRIEKNYRKQAGQIRAVLFQAKEYFAAAQQASFHTSPNHLYYGMVCLASAVMLLNGTGEQSLDFLRQDTANRNHGLDFGLAIASSAAGRGTQLLEGSSVTIRERGHFRNWYERLPMVRDVSGTVTRRDGALQTKSVDTLGASESMSGSSIVGVNSTLLTLLRHVPDFHAEWPRYDIAVPMSRTTVALIIDEPSQTQHLQFTVHGTSRPADFESIIEGFAVPAQYFDVPQLITRPGANAGVVSFRSAPGRPMIPLRFPDIRSTADEVQLMYGETIGTPEWADAYRACFGLSMLSRYYPDYWIRCLEAQCVSAKLIERFVDIYAAKFPTLALSYLANEKIVISTQTVPYQ